MRHRILPALAAGVVVAASAAAQEPPFHSSFVGRYDVSGASYGDVWGDGAFAYVGHYLQNQIDVLDLSNPASPTLASHIVVPSPNNSASAQDVKVADGLLFVALESGGTDGVAIYDVRDPYNPVLRTLVDAEPGAYEFIHNVFYDQGWLYICNSSDTTLAIVDLRTYDPDSAPAAITTFAYKLSNVASTFVHDMTVVDGYLYVSGWDSMWVYDVRNLGQQAPQLIATERGICSHAVWAASGTTYVVTTEEREGGAARLYEVSIQGSSFDLIPRDSWSPAKTSAYSVHNAVWCDGRFYVSCYQKGGLVFDVDDTSKTWELVASYDTSTAGTSGFAGSWGVSPLPGIDQVLLSDLSNGLYVIDYSALDFDWNAARPRTFDPAAGATVDVSIRDLGNAVLDAATPTLYARVDNGAFTAIPMTDVGGSWQAGLPAASEGQRVDYYVEAQDTQGRTWRQPIDAPTTFHTSYASSSLTQVFSDDFSTDQGWAVSGSVQSGAWVRVDPNATGGQSEDDDPDGTDTMCYVTGNASPGSGDGQADVDGGPTILTSPDLDFSAGDGLLSWSRWFFVDDADPADDMLIEISNDGGATWTTVSDLTVTAGGWHHDVVRVSDYVAPTGQVRLRFSVSDNPNNSVTEGAVDTVVAEVFGGGTDATVTFRNGSGANPAAFSSLSDPILGTTWTSQIDAGSVGASSGLTYVVGYQAPLAGLPTSFGELLVDVTSPFISLTSATVVGGIATHPAPVPNDNALLGFAFSTQGYVGQGGVLTNALDLVLGDR